MELFMQPGHVLQTFSLIYLHHYSFVTLTDLLYLHPYAIIGHLCTTVHSTLNRRPAAGEAAFGREFVTMGVATGGDGGDMSPPPGSEFRGGMSPQKSRFFKGNFLNIYRKVEIFRYFRKKWAKSEEKSEFGGRWF